MFLTKKIITKSFTVSHRHTTVLIMSIIVIFVLSLIIFSFEPIIIASAQGSTVVKPKGLTLSPLRNELEIEPGTSLDGVLKITNNSTKTMAVTMSAEVFSVINQQYDYAFTAESNVVKWVSFNHPNINLEPGNSENITYSVGVPLSAEPGGRYISLFASTDTNSDNSAVESKQRIASLLYITVSGDISRVGYLVSLSSPWLISGDSIWNVALQNTGTTHYRSRYNLQIKDLLWNGTVTDMSGEVLILPGTIRLISDTMPAPLWPGLYKAVYNIGLGDNPAVTKTHLILYMPTWATIFVLVVFATLVYWFIRKRIIKKTS